MDAILKQSLTVEMKTTEQKFPVTLFTVHDGSNFSACGRNSNRARGVKLRQHQGIETRAARTSRVPQLRAPYISQAPATQATIQMKLLSDCAVLSCNFVYFSESPRSLR